MTHEMTQGRVTIDKDVYDSLVEDRKWLRCLESAGVDNWDGISYAFELLRESE